MVLAQPSTPLHLLSNLNLSLRPYRKSAFKQRSHSHTPPPGSFSSLLRSSERKVSPLKPLSKPGRALSISPTPIGTVDSEDLSDISDNFALDQNTESPPEKIFVSYH